MSHSTALNRLVLTAVALLLSSKGVAHAQTPGQKTNAWEVRVSGGAFVPTGDQRNVLKNSQLTALQVSRLLHSSLALTGTFSWARSRDLTSIGTPKLDVFTSDLGFEVRPSQWFTGSVVTFDAFAGLGGGARSYNYRKLDVGATHNLAGYGAIGGELGMGRVGLRLEVRDYVTGFKPLVGSGISRTRNDVVYTVALRFNRNRAPQN
jgi:hypothetical protein